MAKRTTSTKKKGFGLLAGGLLAAGLYYYMSGKTQTPQAPTQIPQAPIQPQVNQSDIDALKQAYGEYQAQKLSINSKLDSVYKAAEAYALEIQLPETYKGMHADVYKAMDVNNQQADNLRAQLSTVNDNIAKVSAALNQLGATF